MDTVELLVVAMCRCGIRRHGAENRVNRSICTSNFHCLLPVIEILFSQYLAFFLELPGLVCRCSIARHLLPKVEPFLVHLGGMHTVHNRFAGNLGDCLIVLDVSGVPDLSLKGISATERFNALDIQWRYKFRHASRVSNPQLMDQSELDTNEQSNHACGHLYGQPS